jgi:hypothetical protein
MKAYRRPARRGAGPGEEPRGLKAWFREQHRRTSYITVSVAGLSLLGTLGLGLWNISLQIGRPELETLYDHILSYEDGTGWRGRVAWRNGGKQSGNSLFLTVYATDEDGMRQDKLWADFCDTPSSVVIPNNPVDCDVRLAVVNHPPDHLLICVAYSEKRKKYRQAFWYRSLPPVQQQTGGQPPQRWTALLVEEFPRLNEELCR